MHHLSPAIPDGGYVLLIGFQGYVKRPGEFFALRRIKPHTPPLVRPPSIPLSFNLAAVLPQAEYLLLTPAQKGSIPPTPSTHQFTAVDYQGI